MPSLSTEPREVAADTPTAPTQSNLSPAVAAVFASFALALGASGCCKCPDEPLTINVNHNNNADDHHHHDKKEKDDNKGCKGCCANPCECQPKPKCKPEPCCDKTDPCGNRDVIIIREDLHQHQSPQPGTIHRKRKRRRRPLLTNQPPINSDCRVKTYWESKAERKKRRCREGRGRGC